MPWLEQVNAWWHGMPLEERRIPARTGDALWTAQQW